MAKATGYRMGEWIATNEFPKIHFPATKPSAQQISGKHYKDFLIQPVEFCYRNNIPYLEGSAIKYICRHKNKNGADDIKKAIHFLEILLEYEYVEKETP